MCCLDFQQHDTLSCACGQGLALGMDESCWFPSMIDHQAASKEKKNGILTMQGKEPKIFHLSSKGSQSAIILWNDIISAMEVEIWFGSKLYNRVSMAMQISSIKGISLTLP